MQIFFLRIVNASTDMLHLLKTLDMHFFKVFFFSFTIPVKALTHIFSKKTLCCIFQTSALENRLWRNITWEFLKWTHHCCLFFFLKKERKKKGITSYFLHLQVSLWQPPALGPGIELSTSKSQSSGTMSPIQAECTRRAWERREEGALQCPFSSACVIFLWPWSLYRVGLWLSRFFVYGSLVVYYKASSSLERCGRCFISCRGLLQLN